MNNHDGMDGADTGTMGVQGGMGQADDILSAPEDAPADAAKAVPGSDGAEPPPLTVVGVVDSGDVKAGRTVRAAALPPERTGRRDRAVILREARVRILESKAPPPAQGADGRTGMPAAPRRPGKWKTRIKRLGWAIGGSVLLAACGVFLILTVGDGGLSDMKAFLHKAWMPALFARLTVYSVLAWQVWPVIMRRARNQALARLQALQSELLAEDPIDHYALEAVSAQMRQANDARISRVVVMGILLVIELVFVQLPYLLMP